MKHIILSVLLLTTLRLSAQHQYLALSEQNMVYYLIENTVIKTMPISSASSLTGYMRRNDSIEIVINDGAGALKYESFEALLKQVPDKKTVPLLKTAFITDPNKPTLTDDSFFMGHRTLEAFTYEYKTNRMLVIDDEGNIYLFQDGKVIWHKFKRGEWSWGLGTMLDKDLIKSIRFSVDNRMIYIEARKKFSESFHLIELDLASGKGRVIANERDGKITDAFYSEDGKYICYSKNHHNEERAYRYNREDNKTERNFIELNNRKIFLKKMFEINE